MALIYKFLFLFFSLNLFAQDSSILIRTLYVEKDSIPYKVRLSCTHNSKSKRCSPEDFDKEAKKICDEFKLDFKLQSTLACIEPFEEELNKKGEPIEKRCKLADYDCIPKPVKELEDKKTK